MTLPEDFETYTRQLMGDKLYAQLRHGIEEEEAPTSIRLNPYKVPEGTHVAPQYGCKPLDESSAQDDGKHEALVPWCPSYGRYLGSRPNFTFDPLFHGGLYYAQEASSMMVDLVVRQLISQPVLMLDLCAAPGGKSTALRSALPKGSMLISNEPMRTRAQILAENIQKFGHPDTIVTNNYPRDYQKGGLLFDAILADVPCSGEGMFRKDEGAIREWSTQNVSNCWQLQREIIADIWPCLKPGGWLIYSTCTFNAHEDEENVAWIAEHLGADCIQLDTAPEWGITPNLVSQFPVYRFLPGKTRGEGLFMAVLRKSDDDECINVKPSKATKPGKKDRKGKNASRGGSHQMAGIPTGWLNAGSRQWQPIEVGDTLCAIDKPWLDTYERVAANLKVLHAGVALGNQKGKDLIPAQGLALSTALDRNHFAQVELSYTDALRYLRKEAVALPEETPRGYVLVTYRNQPLGWEKNIGNRANNLYPQEWKIKTTHTPEQDSPIIEW